MSHGFCKTAYDLVVEVAQVPSENIPIFNDDAFRSVIDEVQLQHEQLTQVFNNALSRHRDMQGYEDFSQQEESQALLIWHGSEAEATEVMVYHTAILRNKRLLLAYIKRRLDLIQDLRWTHGSLPEHVRDNLTPQELHFFKEYSKILNKYMRSPDMGGIGLDLTADPVPPDDPYVQVRVMKDYGEVTFSSGTVKLKKGQSHWLLRDEAHPLLMDEVLECVS